MRKQIVFDLPLKDHTEIKKRATEQGISIKRYVLKAIIKLQIEEDRYK